VRKGEKGSLVVYANTFTKTGTDDSGAEVETEIPFMKGYKAVDYPHGLQPQQGTEPTEAMQEAA